MPRRFIYKSVCKCKCTFFSERVLEHVKTFEKRKQWIGISSRCHIKAGVTDSILLFCIPLPSRGLFKCETLQAHFPALKSSRLRSCNELFCCFQSLKAHMLQELFYSVLIDLPLVSPFISCFLVFNITGGVNSIGRL